MRALALDGDNMEKLFVWKYREIFNNSSKISKR